MKVCVVGIDDFDFGKHRYEDSRVEKITQKFHPEHIIHTFVDFISFDEKDLADCFVCTLDKRLDLIIEDIGLSESRIMKSENEEEKNLFTKCKKFLEEETTLDQVEFSDREKQILSNFHLLTLKPIYWIEKDKTLSLEELMKECLFITNTIFFFTVNQKQLNPWMIKKGTTVVKAASKIHSDMERGFIRAEVFNCKDLDQFHNLNEAKARGFVRVENKDYIVEDGDIIHIRFSV